MEFPGLATNEQENTVSLSPPEDSSHVSSECVGEFEAAAALGSLELMSAQARQAKVNLAHLDMPEPYRWSTAEVKRLVAWDRYLDGFSRVNDFKEDPAA